MIHNVLFAAWFLLPAAAANVAPIITNKLPLLRRWQTPLDFGKTFHGKEVFGKHKSWRGLVSGIVVATITLALQQYAARHSHWVAALVHETTYTALPSLVLGPLFGFGGSANRHSCRHRTLAGLQYRDVTTFNSWTKPTLAKKGYHFRRFILTGPARVCLFAFRFPCIQTGIKQ